jgi:hypothetical protein
MTFDVNLNLVGASIQDELELVDELNPKRQRTAALQDAVAIDCVPHLPRGLGVRLSSAAFIRTFMRAISCRIARRYRYVWIP